MLFFLLNYSVRSLHSHTNSCNNAVTCTQCHVDGAQRPWATCGLMSPSNLCHHQFFTKKETPISPVEIEWPNFQSLFYSGKDIHCFLFHVDHNVLCCVLIVIFFLNACTQSCSRAVNTLTIDISCLFFVHCSHWPGGINFGKVKNCCVQGNFNCHDY